MKQTRIAPPLPSHAKAWLLIDVDGVLNLDVSNSQSKRLSLTRTRVRSWRSGWSYTLHLQTWLGDALREQRARVLSPAWCTTWFAEVEDSGRPASIALVTRLGRDLPAVDLSDYAQDPRASKVTGIEQFFDEHPAPFVWIDDDPAPGDEQRLEALASKTGQPNLLIKCKPDQGLTREQFDHALDWADSL